MQANAMAQMNNSKIQSELLKDECNWIDFIMNVPHAFHMGGVWERIIRSARNALFALLMNHGDRLDDELLRTLIVEVEARVNNRPLTLVDTNSIDSHISPEP